jgi:ATP-binding protein involved in chromosome partitioning
MVSKEQVIERLAEFYDGDYHQSALELGLIRDIIVKDDGVKLTYVVAGENANTELYRRELEEALSSIGVSQAHIRFRAITEYERQAVEGKLGLHPSQRPGRASGQSSDAGTGSGPVQTSLLDAAGKTSFIAIASGKGGVGKSTVTVNLAVALARLGLRVGIIDADIYGFSVPDMMGIETRPVKSASGDKIVPVERFGVKVMSMGFFVEDNAPIIWRGPMLGKMLQNFFAEVEWGELDYMLLDLPPGTGDVALDVHQLLPSSREILVTTPHATAAFVAARAGAMAVQTGHEVIGIVENMSHYVNRLGEIEYVFGRGGGAKLAQELHTELLAQIPLGAPDNPVADPDYSPAVYSPDTSTGKLYHELAVRIEEKQKI